MITDIIAINYNTAKWFKNCIEKILLYTSNFRLIAIDNGSNEISSLKYFSELEEILNKKRIENQILKIEKNVGYGQAINKGIEYSKSDFFIVISADVEVCNEGWLKGLLETIQSDEQFGIVVPKYYLDKEKTLLGGTGFYMKNNKLWVRGWMEKDKGLYNKREEMDSLCGALMMIRRSAFDKVDGFSPEFYLYFEETDFIFKLRQKGYKAIYEPSVEVIHYWNKTPDLNKEKYYKESEEIFYKKWKNFLI